MRKTFIVATLSNRIAGLKTLLTGISFYYPDWNVSIVAQDYSNEQKNDMNAFVKTLNNPIKIEYKDEMIGAHSAKVIAINQVESDIYCSMDDDMEVIGLTNYEAIVDKLAKDKASGIITSNWVKSETMLKNKEIKDEFVETKLVYTGGGLLFRKDVANIILSIPNEQYLFDDCLWALYAYINGYTNYRYRGSVAIHRICTVGGRRSWLKNGKNKVLPPSDLMIARKGKGKEGTNDEYLICTDRDVTTLSVELHKRNKR